jgi:CRP-like cAMP-binding protein
MDNFTLASNMTQNFLLGLLPPAERERLLPYLETVAFPLGKIVYEPGERVDFCYFPANAVVSLLYTMQDGSTAEMGLVGNDGVTGVAIFLGGESTCCRTVVALAGEAFRLPATHLQREFERHGSLQQFLCDIRRRSSRRFRKPPCAIACTLWNSDSAAGYYCVTTERVVQIG